MAGEFAGGVAHSAAVSAGTVGQRRWRTTVGLKALMAGTGAVLAAFLVFHLLGNLLVFRGPAALDSYSALLHRDPLLLWGARAVLLLSALVHVGELAPGLGTTTRMVLASSPSSYVGIERDEAAARAARRALRPEDQVRQGTASRTGLEDGCATVVFGEAMLTMQTASEKRSIVREVHRILREGGRYGIHELALAPDDLSEGRKAEIQRALSEVIHVGARPLTATEWGQLLEEGGFELEDRAMAPMHLLEPRRLVADEGVLGALRIAGNLVRTPAARRRVSAMRSVFREYAANMCAVAIVARKQRGARHG